MPGSIFSGWARQSRWNGRRYVTPMMNYDLYSVETNFTRLMYSSKDDVLIQYPLLPTATRNFSFDVLQRRDLIREKTLTSSKTTIWDPVFDDVVITETWESPGGLAFTWEFFHKLHTLYLQDTDWLAGEYLLWRPFDLTDAVYPIDIMSVTVDGDDFNIDWKGIPLGTFSPVQGENGVNCSVAGRDLMSSKTLEIKFTIRPETAPTVSVFATAGSLTGETALFSPE